MARLVPSLILGALAAFTLAFAAEPPAPAAPNADPSALPPVSAPSAAKAAPAAPARPRAISPGVASILSAAMPVKYDPEVSKAAAAKAAAGTSSLADSEAPANGIVRLNPMFVQGNRPRIFKEYQIYSPQGLRELAFRRYITSEVDRALNKFTIPLFGMSAYERAMMMYREDERLRNIADTADMARFVSLTDPEAGTYIKRVAEKTYMRTNDFGWNGGATGNAR